VPLQKGGLAGRKAEVVHVAVEAFALAVAAGAAVKQYRDCEEAADDE
jgi:hypothetical protein